MRDKDLQRHKSSLDSFLARAEEVFGMLLAYSWDDVVGEHEA